MLNEKLEEKLKNKIQKLKISEEEQELLLKELDILSNIIVKNVQTFRKEN